MKNILTISNTISLLRLPLSLLFLFQSITIRIIAIIAAMLSDCIDGYLARRSKTETWLGKVLDPLMDKFFVYVVIIVFTFEGSLSTFELLALLARDFAVLCYTLTVLGKYGWSDLVFLPAYSSKITTGLQFVTLLSITLYYPPPSFLYYILLLLAPVIYGELLYNTISHRKKIS